MVDIFYILQNDVHTLLADNQGSRDLPDDDGTVRAKVWA